MDETPVSDALYICDLRKKKNPRGRVGDPERKGEVRPRGLPNATYTIITGMTTNEGRLARLRGH